jgi:hypothetical protein
LNKFEKEESSKEKVLDSYFKTEVIKKAKKLKVKYPPISEIIDGVRKVLRIEAIYELSEEFRNFYLIKVRNFQNNPKVRYFLTIILASQSSDFLVILAKNFIKEIRNIKLIQFSIHPKNLRISLLALKEVKIHDEFLNSVKILRDLRINFRKKLASLKNLLKNH